MHLICQLLLQHSKYHNYTILIYHSNFKHILLYLQSFLYLDNHNIFSSNNLTSIQNSIHTTLHNTNSVHTYNSFTTQIYIQTPTVCSITKSKPLLQPLKFTCTTKITFLSLIHKPFNQLKLLNHIQTKQFNFKQ